MYQTGISVTRDQNTLLATYLNKIIPYLKISQNVFNDLLIYLGGIIVIIGFLMSVSSLSTPQVIHVKSALKPASETAPDEVSEVPKCKFCGETVTEDDIFCPECNRALK